MHWKQILVILLVCVLAVYAQRQGRRPGGYPGGRGVERGRQRRASDQVGDLPPREDRPPKGDGPPRGDRPPRGDGPPRGDRPPRGDGPPRGDRPPRGDGPPGDRPAPLPQPQGDAAQGAPAGNLRSAGGRPGRRERPDRDGQEGLNRGEMLGRRRGGRRGGKPQECEATEDCREGDVCAAVSRSACRPTCVTNADCEDVGEGQVCLDGACDRAPKPEQCSADSDCPTGDSCNDGSCRKIRLHQKCEADEDCTTEGQGCSKKNPQAPGGVCLQACSTDFPCPEGTECNGGYCKKTRPPPCNETSDCTIAGEGCSQRDENSRGICLATCDPEGENTCRAGTECSEDGFCKKPRGRHGGRGRRGPPEPCTEGSCGDNEKCVTKSNTVCLRSCSEGRPCSRRVVCESGTCRRGPPPPPPSDETVLP